MNLRTSILILGLLCFQLPVFAEHALGTPSEEEPETPETTENPSEAASAILEKLSAGRRSVYSRNVSEALDQLLAEPKERKKLIIDYVEALKGLSAEKREKAVEDFLAKITIRDELDTFFEEARKLPKDPAEGIEKAVLKMKPTDSERLWRYLSKAGQQAAVEKALPEARKNPGMAGSLARAAEDSGFQFSKADLDFFVDQKKYFPEILRQFTKDNPEGTKKLLDTFRSSQQSDVSASHDIASAIDSGAIHLDHSQRLYLQEIIKDQETAPASTEKAFRVLEKTAPELATGLIRELSKSQVPGDLVKAATILGLKNPKAEELLDQVVRTADSQLLDVVAKQFPEFVPALEGLSPEKLKALVQWSLGNESQMSGKVFRLALSDLSKSATAADLLPLFRTGLDKKPTEALEVLDALDPKAAKSYGELAPLAMKEVMGKFSGILTTSTNLDIAGARFMGHFPTEVEKQTDFLMEKTKGTWADTALSLLGALENPKHLGTFLSHMNGEQGAVSFSASQALGRLLKARPELVTAEVEQRLNQVLGAKDEKDLSRLHLRQNLPEELVARLNKKLLEDQKVEPGRLDAVLERATQAALDLQKKEGMGLMGVGQRALAIEYLIRSGHPEAVEKASQFLETAFPKGYIHNINAIQGVIQASREAGIELPAATLEKIQARLEKDGRMLWNSGNPEMRKGEDSNLIPYGGAAYITTAPDPGQLNETQKQILDRLSQMKGKPVPYFFDSKDKSQEKGPLLDPAPTSGRTVTAALASYLTAPEGKKPDSAERLLTAARTFSDHFSQTHEIPISSERTHDRTPGAQQMAAYYGFANDPNLARALTLLSHDPSLSAEKRKEAQDLATQFQTRLLSLTESDGRIRQRQVESYPNENQVHQLFTGLTLLRLNRQTASPQARLLQKAK